MIPYSLYQINSPTSLYTTISYYNTCRSQSYHPDHQSHPNLWKLLSWIHRLFYVDLMLVSDGQLSLHCLFRCYRYSTHWDLEEILEKYFQAKFSDRCLWHLLWNCPQMDVNKPYWWRTKQWLGTVRQKAITWTNVDSDLWRHMRVTRPQWVKIWMLLMLGMIGWQLHELSQHAIC